MAAYAHGTDCNMVRSIARDMATAEMAQRVNCSRFAAGGAFHRVEILTKWIQGAADTSAAPLKSCGLTRRLGGDCR